MPMTITTLPSRWAIFVATASAVGLVSGTTTVVGVSEDNKKARYAGVALLAIGAIGVAHLFFKGHTGIYNGGTVQRFTGSFDISKVDPNVVALQFFSCDNLTDLSGLEAFSQLKSISLGDCPITSESLASIGKLKTLTHLSINACPNITTLKDLTTGPNLIHLQFINLSVTGEGLKHVQFHPEKEICVTFRHCPNLNKNLLPKHGFHYHFDGYMPQHRFH